MCARESSFFAGNADGRRGWATAVTLTKVAQLENRGGHFVADDDDDDDDDEEEEWRRGSSRERDRDETENIRVLLGISIYFASNLHVSPRVSPLFRAQHSCGTAISRPLLSPPPISVLRVSFSFFPYVSSPRWPTNKRVILSSPTPVVHPRLELKIYPLLSRRRKPRLDSATKNIGFVHAFALGALSEFRNRTSSVSFIAVYFNPRQF